MIAAYLFVILTTSYLFKTLFHRVFRSPLAHLPGPQITVISGLCLVFKEFTRQRRKWIHKLHLQYGPIVRLSPNEVSFATWDAAKEIYVSGGSGYDKTSFYDLFDNFSTKNTFSTLDKDMHATTKRRFIDRYNKSSVMQPNAVCGIRERAEEFVAKCTESPGKSANIYLYLHCYALDCITHHLFHPYGIHSLTNPSDMSKMRELSYRDTIRSQYLQYYFPKIMAMTARFKHRKNRRGDIVASYVLDLVQNSPETDSSTVLQRLKTQKDTLDDLYVASECMDHLVAGIDTTGDALCFLIHHLSLPESYSIQQKLREELVAHPIDSFDDLPYLDAVVKEGLRCFSPIPMSLPRKVPSGGRMVAGVFIPEDTIVSCQAYTLHRLDPEVFPSPEKFSPERWLESAGSTARNQMFFAFSTGGRACIGKHLAVLEMKLLLQEVYRSYHTKVWEGMKASMALDDQIIASRPKDQICSITFERLSV
ncbi:cytochrome P450 [Obba rivulosa]|uniref:Cytochrome P450 n=1 Tax=Obba rivulosa TaxID=1052685 RepID=A0A8E2AS18_9APHY|nr:cytochrome P450 [Obba rivulosa]